MNSDPALPMRPVHDPLGIALLGALALHGLLLLGVSFDINRDPPPRLERTLDITLVKPSPKPPAKVEDPTQLAQQSQEGGGTETLKERETSPLGNPVAAPKKPTPAPQLTRAGAAEPAPRKERVVVTRKESPKPQPVAKPVKEVEAPPRPSIAQLLSSTQREINRLSADLDRRSRAAAKNQRRKHVSASTQEYKYATYLEDWRRKVERIGNLNYPDEARRRSLHGHLMLHVAVRADGTIERIKVIRSSGHKVLDDAAKRIVRLSAPFAPFPEDIRKEVDILDITRTWKFQRGNRLFSD